MKHNGIFNKNGNRVICMILAITIVLALVLPGSFSVSADSNDTATATDAGEIEATEENAHGNSYIASYRGSGNMVSYGRENDTVRKSSELEKLSLEVNPVEGEDVTITLEGMMPKGATASVDDVMDDFTYEDIASATDAETSGSVDADTASTGETVHHENDEDESALESPAVVAAYDITIRDDNDDEFQPVEDKPIHVEITDPAIAGSKATELWHIKDDGGCEKIEKFTVEEGKISFDAEGFSVYVIAEGPEKYEAEEKYAESVVELTGIESGEGFYLLYTDAGGSNHYFTNICNTKGCLIEKGNIAEGSVWCFEKEEDVYYLYTYVSGEKRYLYNIKGNLVEVSNENKTAFEIAETDGGFYIKKKEEGKWIQHSNGGGGIRFYTDNNNKTNCTIKAVFESSVALPDDVYELDGKTYGLMYYTSGTSGSALMAKEKNDALESASLLIKDNTVDVGEVLYVYQDADITEWKFNSVEKDYYTLSTEVDGVIKYIKLNDNKLALTENEPTEFKVLVNNGKISLVSGQKAISYEGGNLFKSTNAGTSDKYYLNLVKKSNLTEEDFVTYSANKIGISKVPDGSKVIVYTRVWDDSRKVYDFYAINHDGTLYPCYERGDSIMWIGSQINTLLWDFTEYHNDDGTPNNYYELYNDYSEKYLAPQLQRNQVLADEPVGINLPGRKDGEYYSTILAWDDPNYTYAGLAADGTTREVTSTSKVFADTFYFATVEEVEDTLTPVTTIDNTQYGITMRMVDFDNRAQQDGVLGDSSAAHGFAAYKDILSTDIGEDGYPSTKGGKSLGELFGEAKPVNHLFVESTYSASGYFEYDSCQNFASLKGKDEGDFTVYKEIGTMSRRNNSTDKHGQFMPYNDIEAGVYSTVNPYNLNDVKGNPLPESDPRKYEKLYRVGNDGNDDATNWHFGMEIDASFVQTPNGKDSWGHDIIFEFTGDDDFWLYVDDELVIDLGGVHSAIPGSVNFSTGEVLQTSNKENEVIKSNLRTIYEENYKSRNPDASEEEISEYLSKHFKENSSVFKDYSPHTMKIFYMERGEGASNLHMRFNLSYVTKGHVIFSKKITGSDDVDFSLVQYPYQIWYKDKKDDKAKILTSSTELINVTYQNSTQKVEYAESYTPPGSNTTYESVYFLYPDKAAEIHFPDDTIEYRIIECGINKEVYDHVYINGKELAGENVSADADANRWSYDSDWMQVKDSATVTYENHVDPAGLRTLTFQKQLSDEHGKPLETDDDDTTFSFRLFLSNGVNDDLQLANMVKYYVVDKGGYLCYWDSDAGAFKPSEYRDYTAFAKKDGDSEDESARKEALRRQFTFETSMNGTISKIPAWYSVNVPGLTSGTKFMVEERLDETPLGYGRVDYTRGAGSYITDDPRTNVGRVRKSDSPFMAVVNHRGWGIQVDKVWSDSSYTKYHDNVYLAVYVDGIEEPLPDHIRELKHPDKMVRFYFDKLEEGKQLSDYHIYEVELTDPEVDSEGIVKSYTSIKKLTKSENFTLLHATSKSTNVTAEYSYAVTVEEGEEKSSLASLDHTNVRTDTVTNTRTGGIVMSLYDMTDHDKPLSEGVFELKRFDEESGEYVSEGIFTSDETGRIDILYDFKVNAQYILEEIVSPNGYIGLPGKVAFSVDESHELSITSDNDPEWQEGHKYEANKEQLIAYVNVFNKPYKLEVYKYDDKSDENLPHAKFTMYKGRDGGNGKVVKDYRPLSGYEDMETADNGLIAEINNDLKAGTYYLTESQAPDGYEGLNEDIIFRISPLGGLTLEHSPVNSDVKLVEGDSDEEDVYVYMLRIPNKKSDRKEAKLNITKNVSGNMGNRSEEFTFSFDVSEDSGSEEYELRKNDGTEVTYIKSGETFTLSHNEKAEIILPVGKEVTISEILDGTEGYTSNFKIGDGESRQTDTETFTVSEDTDLMIVNTREGVVPTGIWMTFGILLSACIGLIFVIVYLKRKTIRYKDEV